ncbi:MAG: glycosyl hydrolase [Kiritimatiellae bacterium]|jgi:hypothetical protein|nr:glycosyl hydrolase [Kiritimatiellia bacterium]
MKLLWMMLVVCSVWCASALDLESGFAEPPHDNHPQVWWWFSPYKQASNECITRDLEAMKRVGISGFHIYGGSNDPTSAWKNKVRWVLHEAARLDLDVIICLGSAGCESKNTQPEYAQKEIVFSSAHVKGPGRVEAVLPKMCASKTPKNADGSPKYFWDIAVFAVPDQKSVKLEDVRDISFALDPQTDKVTWDAPEGKWRLIRVGYAPNIFGWGGCYIDHMSREAFDVHWDLTMKPLLLELAPDERSALKGVMCDSWEAGHVSWTPTFAGEFRRRRGYDIKSWLPALTGVVINGMPQTARFQRDFNVTISELLAENHYSYQAEVAGNHGMISIAEAAGPHQHQADVLRLQGRCDVAMGEFWMPNGHRPGLTQRFLVRDAAMAAHIYGIREVLAESFTTINTYWIEKPSTMKPCADRAFCDGLNRVCYHGMMLSPSLTDKPGYIRSAGTHYNPQTTWWEQSKAFNLYLSRCSWMLQQGRFAADALLYHGDGINMFGNLKTPSDALGDGYDYDFVNTELLLQAGVEDGFIVLPSGIRYRVLMLSERNSKASRMEPGTYGPVKLLPPVHNAMTEAVMAKLLVLVKAGATLAGERPSGPSSMHDESSRYHKLADELWGPRGTAPAAVARQVGRGYVIPRLSAARKIMEGKGLKPDFSMEGTDAHIDWIHRTMDNGTEIYFVANESMQPQQIKASFRVIKRTPELWDAVTGKRCSTSFVEKDGLIRVPLSLPAGGSCFVVFRSEKSATLNSGHALTAKPLQEIKGPWNVTFETKWLGPEDGDNKVADGKYEFTQLQDWTKRAEGAIRHYSGTAVYRIKFNTDKAVADSKGPVFLDLGRVEVVAEITLNGKTMGTLWTAPWRIDISSALKEGSNELEVRVTNLWPNRLIGDQALAPEERLTRTNINKYKKDDPLLSSGLLGPVQLVVPAQSQ